MLAFGCSWDVCQDCPRPLVGNDHPWGRSLEAHWGCVSPVSLWRGQWDSEHPTRWQEVSGASRWSFSILKSTARGLGGLLLHCRGDPVCQQGPRQHMKELELGVWGHKSPHGAGVPDGTEQGVPRAGAVQAQRCPGHQLLCRGCTEIHLQWSRGITAAFPSGPDSLANVGVQSPATPSNPAGAAPCETRS